MKTRSERKLPQTFYFELCALCRFLVRGLAMAAAELRKAFPQLLDAVRQAVESTGQGPAHVMQPIAGCHPLFSAEDFAARMKLPESDRRARPIRNTRARLIRFLPWQ